MKRRHIFHQPQPQFAVFSPGIPQTRLYIRPFKNAVRNNKFPRDILDVRLYRRNMNGAITHLSLNLHVIQIPQILERFTPCFQGDRLDAAVFNDIKKSCNNRIFCQQRQRHTPHRGDVDLRAIYLKSDWLCGWGCCGVQQAAHRDLLPHIGLATESEFSSGRHTLQQDIQLRQLQQLLLTGKQIDTGILYLQIQVRYFVFHQA